MKAHLPIKLQLCKCLKLSACQPAYSDHGSPLLVQIQAMGDAARYEMAAGLYLPPTKFAPCNAPYQTPAQTGFAQGCTDAPGIKQAGISHVNLLAQRAEQKSTYHNLQPTVHDVHAGHTVHAWWTCWTDCTCLVDSTTCCNSILACGLLAVQKKLQATALGGSRHDCRKA